MVLKNVSLKSRRLQCKRFTNKSDFYLRFKVLLIIHQKVSLQIPPLPKILDIFKGGDLYKIQNRAAPAEGFYLIDLNFENCIEFVEICSLQSKIFLYNGFHSQTWSSFLEFRMKNIKIKLFSEYVWINLFEESLLSLVCVFFRKYRF